MSKLESQIQKEILKYLRSLPQCLPFKIIAANERGVPDILCCMNGQFIGFEIKRPGGKPTKIQDAQRQRIISAGGQAHVVTSLEDIKQIIERI